MTTAIDPSAAPSQLPSAPGASRAVAGPPGLASAAARWLGARRIDLETCSSSNDEAARMARAGATHGTVVTARTQSSGRGRAGRSWDSPAGGNLYASLILRPALPLRDVPAMTLAIGIAVCQVARAFGAPATLKWPNDVLIHGRKVAGILLESQSRGDRLDVVIAGIGVNLATMPAPAQAPHATALAEHVPAPIDRERFLARLLPMVEHWVDRYIASGLSGILPSWHQLMDPNVDAVAQIAGERVVGTIEGLDDLGALRLRDARGVVHHVIAGEVETLRRGEHVAPVTGEPPPRASDESLVVHPRA